MIGYPATLGSLGLVECDDIVNVVGVAQHSPQLHRNLRRQSDKVFREVGHLSLGQIGLEHIGRLELLNHRSVVIDAPLLGLGEVAGVQNVLDGHLPLVLLNEVTERYSGLEAKERSRKVEQKITIAIFTEHTGRLGGRTVASP